MFNNSVLYTYTFMKRVDLMLCALTAKGLKSSHTKRGEWKLLEELDKIMALIIMMASQVEYIKYQQLFYIIYTSLRQ